jgi:uncharacterized protein YbjT (DUF2867 family)
MKIIVTGSTGNISKPLTALLVNAGHEVTVISSNASKKEEIAQAGAKAAIGSVEDEQFLTNTFTGADAIYTMVPPNFGATDYRQHLGAIGLHYANAIKKSGVKNIVNLSSIGAHLDGGTGPIAGLHDVEKHLNALEGVSVKHIRASFFYVNFFANVDMIKHAGIIGSNYGEQARMVMVHPNDIAAAVAQAFATPFEGKTVQYISSDERTTDEIAATLGKAIGNEKLPWVNFTDEQAFDGMVQAGLPAEISRNYVEMGSAVRSGILWEDYDAKKTKPAGKIKLEQFAEEFKAAF